MNRGLQRNISPRMAALIILVVIAAVQAWWWRAFVYRPKLPSGGGPGPVIPMPAGPRAVFGREDVMVTTVAGAPQPGDKDGMGYEARFDGPTGIAMTSDGRLLVADARNHRIRVVADDTATSTLAGSIQGYADGPASTARFAFPSGVASGPDGAVYVADTGNHRIRVIRDGQVRTLAGGTAGFAAGTGGSARLHAPVALAYASQPKPGLWVADAGNKRIRFAALDGSVDAGVPCGGAPTSVCVDNGWVATIPEKGLILRNGKPEPRIRIVDANIIVRQPCAALPAQFGGLLLADGGQGAVLWVSDGVADVLAGGVVEGRNLFGVRDFEGDAAQFGRIGGFAVDANGRIYVADTDGNAIRRLTVP